MSATNAPVKKKARSSAASADDAAANIAVIGTGRLGLCMCLQLEKAGYNVLGVDINESYVRALNERTFVSQEPGVTEALRGTTNFEACTDISRVATHTNLILLFVDTPSGPADKSYDHSKLSRVLTQLNALKLQRKHIAIGCTVLPGYIRQVGRALLDECTDTTLSYNPEFIAQGAIMNGLVNPDMVLIGEENSEAGDVLAAMYARLCVNEPHVCRMSAESAELCKLAVNCFITAKIAYANAIADVADVTAGADKFDILRAVGADSRIGAKCLLPGYGFGGPCFPRDNRALGQYARSVGVEPHMMEATDRANTQHAERQYEALRAQKRDQYVFEDVAYKPKSPVPIIEHSQKLRVAAMLARRAQARVLIRDREMIVSAVRQEFGNLFEYESLPNDNE